MKATSVWGTGPFILLHFQVVDPSSISVLMSPPCSLQPRSSISFSSFCPYGIFLCIFLGFILRHLVPTLEGAYPRELYSICAHCLPHREVRFPQMWLHAFVVLDTLQFYPHPKDTIDLQGPHRSVTPALFLLRMMDSPSMLLVTACLS